VGFLFKDKKENIGVISWHGSSDGLGTASVWIGPLNPLVSKATSSDVPIRLTGSNLTAYTGTRNTKTEREATIMDLSGSKNEKPNGYRQDKREPVWVPAKCVCPSLWKPTV